MRMRLGRIILILGNVLSVFAVLLLIYEMPFLIGITVTAFLGHLVVGLTKKINP